MFHRNPESAGNMPTSTYYVNARRLNLRAGPSATAAWAGVLDRGVAVHEAAPSPDPRWRHIVTLGPHAREGWVASKYLSKVSPLHEEFAWMPVALAEEGVREVIGPGDNPRIAEYLASTDLDRELAREDETPWCSGFVNWCVEHAGYAGTNSASAGSWRHWGKAAGTGRRGLITVLSRQGGHHVGFWLRKEGRRIILWGGNQRDAVGECDYDESRLIDLREAA